MPFRMPGADEYGDREFKIAAADTYRVTVDGYRLLEGQDAYHEQYNPKSLTRAMIFLVPTGVEGDPDALMVDTEGNELEDPKFVFFFDPHRMGYQPRLAKSRKFACAALNIPYESSLEYEDIPEMLDDLVGRELIATVEVNAKSGRNTITDTRAIPRRVRRPAVEKESLVEAAAKTFAEDVQSTEGGEDY